jgi:D-sedoheptulose 7-phosphate isomerase
MDFVLANFSKTASLIESFIKEDNNLTKLSEVIKQISHRHRNGFKGLTCGNGGSACDAMHYAEELTGRFRLDRKALPAISLTDASHITCVGNDYGFDHIFSRGVEAHGCENDYLIAISTSGNSTNVIQAVKSAKARKMLTIGLLGKDGGMLKNMTDISFIVKADTSDRIQEVHILIIHTIIEGVERELFAENYKAGI